MQVYTESRGSKTNAGRHPLLFRAGGGAKSQRKNQERGTGEKSFRKAAGRLAEEVLRRGKS